MSLNFSIASFDDLNQLFGLQFLHHCLNFPLWSKRTPPCAEQTPSRSNPSLSLSLLQLTTCSSAMPLRRSKHDLTFLFILNYCCWETRSSRPTRRRQRNSFIAPRPATLEQGRCTCRRRERESRSTLPGKELSEPTTSSVNFERNSRDKTLRTARCFFASSKPRIAIVVDADSTLQWANSIGTIPSRSNPSRILSLLQQNQPKFLVYFITESGIIDFHIFLRRFSNW